MATPQDDQFDYSNIGFDPLMKPLDAPISQKRGFISAYTAQVQNEASPYLHRTAVGKGTIQANLGGILELRDSTGGTILLTADPKTGTVIIAGPLQANVTLNFGTVNNTAFAGTSSNIGTLNNTKLITNGTWNNGTLGTPAITGGTISNSILNANTLDSPSIINGTINNVVFGTPSIIGGSANNLNLGTPTIGTAQFTSGTAVGLTLNTGTIGDKLAVLTGANKSAGKGTLTSGSVTISTTAITANSLIFLTNTSAGAANLGFLAIGVINAGTSFNVHSSNILDAGTFNWWFIN